MRVSMELSEIATRQKQAIVLRNVDIGVLGKLLNQQKQDGQNAVELIESSRPAPKKGAPEPGKGGSVDYVA